MKNRRLKRRTSSSVSGGDSAVAGAGGGGSAVEGALVADFSGVDFVVSTERSEHESAGGRAGGAELTVLDAEVALFPAERLVDRSAVEEDLGIGVEDTVATVSGWGDTALGPGDTGFAWAVLVVWITETGDATGARSSVAGSGIRGAGRAKVTGFSGGDSAIPAGGKDADVLGSTIERLWTVGIGGTAREAASLDAAAGVTLGIEAAGLTVIEETGGGAGRGGVSVVGAVVTDLSAVGLDEGVAAAGGVCCDR